MTGVRAWVCALLVAACTTKAAETKPEAPATCARERERLLARLHEASRCTTARDCKEGYLLPCPFPCHAVLNLDSQQSHELVAAMERYGQRCEWCDYRCLPDRTKPIVCDHGLCVR